jgi:hypothetical protein
VIYLGDANFKHAVERVTPTSAHRNEHSNWANARPFFNFFRSGNVILTHSQGSKGMQRHHMHDLAHDGHSLHNAREWCGREHDVQFGILYHCAIEQLRIKDSDTEQWTACAFHCFECNVSSCQSGYHTTTPNHGRLLHRGKCGKFMLPVCPDRQHELPGCHCLSI